MHPVRVPVIELDEEPVLRAHSHLRRPALPRLASVRPRRCAVADAGYDSEANLRLARLDLNVDAIVPPKAGRPTDKPAAEPLRREMQERFASGVDKPVYGQRWQAETVTSTIKRNLGSALRARTAVRRPHELLLRVLTHNIMLLAEG
jgi:hypothetical protein